MKTILLLASSLLMLLPSPASGMQESGAGAPLGRLNVPAEKMAGQCTTMVSPIYPRTTADTVTTVVVRAVIWRSGTVSPLHAQSGPPALQSAAMNAVRLWRFKPFIHDDQPVDVTTDISVEFVPGKPGGMVTHPTH